MIMHESGPVPARFGSVIFDFDLTLADSSTGVIECANHALTQMGLPPAHPETIRGTIGMPLDAAYERLAEKSHAAGSEEFTRLFVERADQVMLRGIRLFDTVKPSVGALLAGGVGLGIVSTKFRYRIEAVLERDGLSHAFQVVVGSEDVAAPKPDPTGLNMAINKLGSRHPQVLFVGDSLVDAETAARAGVAFVAVLSGVTPREAFEAYRPCAVIEDLSLLPALVL